jgi:hypothetical protein
VTTPGPGVSARRRSWALFPLPHLTAEAAPAAAALPGGRASQPEGLSDREAIEALRCDLRWKVACGLALTEEGFHPTTLTYWRRWLAGSTAPNRMLSGR